MKAGLVSLNRSPTLRTLLSLRLSLLVAGQLIYHESA